MARHRHLSIVRDEEDENASMRQAVQQIAERVPHQMERSYDWGDPTATALFETISHLVPLGYTATWVEEAVDIPGLQDAYLDWLGGQG